MGSFDMNAQLLAWVQGKTGGQDKGEKNFVWIGHKTAPGSNNGKWVEDDCEKMQQNQFKGTSSAATGARSRATRKSPFAGAATGRVVTATPSTPPWGAPFSSTPARTWALPRSTSPRIL